MIWPKRESRMPEIEGVVIKELVTHPDERGKSLFRSYEKIWPAYCVD